ncbi:MAG: thymidylate kinase [Oscillospiraceae bacterium]|jgi:dTMP kinase|nr:thymidylate kinase [Oscillospiraceae bacterium]
MKGKLIVLEGIDGSGKSTQFKLLKERLTLEGRPFRSVTFPRYDKDSSALIRSYLGGEFGSDPGDVSAWAASVFFFVDRYASFKTDWGEYYNNGGLVLCDRYTTSNAIHQGAKLEPSRLGGFLDWLFEFEYTLMELPKPDAVLYMDIDLKTSLDQLCGRQSSDGSVGDIHETHADYLENCLRAGDFSAAHLGWRRISCLRDGAMRTQSEIHGDVYKIVKELL